MCLYKHTLFSEDFKKHIHCWLRSTSTILFIPSRIMEWQPVEPTRFWTRCLAPWVKMPMVEWYSDSIFFLQVLWFTSRKLSVRLQTSRPCLDHHQQSSLLLLLLVRTSSESYPFFSSILLYYDFLILLPLFHYNISTVFLGLFNFVCPRKFNTWLILIHSSNISIKSPQMLN